MNRPSALPGRSRCLLIVLCALALGACDRAARLTLVTPRLDIDRDVARSLTDLLEGAGPVDVDLVPSPDPEQSAVDVLTRGRADLALVADAVPYDPNMTTVMPLYPVVLHIAYRADQPLLDVRDLFSGRTVYAGPPGSASRQLLQVLAERNGVSPGALRYADQSCADVILVYAPVMPDVPERIQPCGQYRLFSMGAEEDLGHGSSLDAVNLLTTGLEPFVIPTGTYGDMTPAPVVTIAAHRLLVARASLPDAAVYDLIGEIVRLQPALAAAHPGLFRHLTGDFRSRGFSYALHPGAMAYLERNEPGFYERYSGVAEVLVTLMIGLVSGTYAVLRILSIRRKNRIDEFYREAMDLRDRYASAGTDADRDAALTQLKALQDRAYDLLIREKLTADTSFMIFLSLLNDIVADIRRG